MLKPTLLLFISFIFSYYQSLAQINAFHAGQQDSSAAVQQVKLVDPLIISERIDGPANVRDKTGGSLLFTLNDNVPVETAEEVNKWYQISVTLDLSPAQYKSYRIEKGSTLYANGQSVGTAMAELKLDEVFNEQNKLTGALIGYTSVKNIKTGTLPEAVLSGIFEQHKTELAQYNDFIKGFQFEKSSSCGYTSYYLNGGIVYGPSAPIRLELLFTEKNDLFGVVHLRKLGYRGVTYKLNRGFYLTVLTPQPDGKVKEFIRQFNKMINLAD